MKTKTIWILALALAAAWTVGCGRKKAQHFGEPFTVAPRVAIAQLLETPEAYRRQTVRVQGEIERQCPAAGCWLFLRDGQGRLPSSWEVIYAQAWAPAPGMPIREGGHEVAAVPLSQIPIRRRPQP